jgi:hypothetical protein
VNCVETWRLLLLTSDLYPFVAPLYPGRFLLSRRGPSAIQHKAVILLIRNQHKEQARLSANSRTHFRAKRSERKCLKEMALPTGFEPVLQP